MSISAADRRPDLTYVAMIHHGIDLDGFLAHGLDEAVASLGKFGALEPKACRAGVEARFSLARIVAEHAAVDDDILRSGR
ncbi:MAG: hypothetical protein WAV54_00315 [Acidimicrobiales bacterium]